MRPSYVANVDQLDHQYPESKSVYKVIQPPGGLGSAQTFTTPEGMKGDNFMKFIESKSGKPIKNINKLLRSSTLVLILLGTTLAPLASASLGTTSQCIFTNE